MLGAARIDSARRGVEMAAILHFVGLFRTNEDVVLRSRDFEPQISVTRDWQQGAKGGAGNVGVGQFEPRRIDRYVDGVAWVLVLLIGHVQ